MAEDVISRSTGLYKEDSYGGKGSPVDAVMHTSTQEEDAEPSVMTLFDLAAIVTAKHVSCQEIEEHRPPLDEAILKKVKHNYYCITVFNIITALCY